MVDDGEPELDAIDEALALAGALPPSVVAALFARYGKPIEGELPPVQGDDRRIALAAEGVAAGTALRVLNVRTPVDVIGNDWFVLEAPGAEALAVAGPLFAAALAALTRAARLAEAKKLADAKK